jgi:hypothetical protein
MLTLVRLATSSPYTANTAVVAACRVAERVTAGLDPPVKVLPSRTATSCASTRRRHGRWQGAAGARADRRLRIGRSGRRGAARSAPLVSDGLLVPVVAINKQTAKWKAIPTSSAAV